MYMQHLAHPLTLIMYWVNVYGKYMNASWPHTDKICILWGTLFALLGLILFILHWYYYNKTHGPDLVSGYQEVKYPYGHCEGPLDKA